MVMEEVWLTKIVHDIKFQRITVICSAGFEPKFLVLHNFIEAREDIYTSTAVLALRSYLASK